MSESGKFRAPWSMHRELLKGIDREYIGNILKILGQSENFDFSLYGSWEPLDMCKSMPQGPLSFSTPGKPISENFICFTFFTHNLTF